MKHSEETAAGGSMGLTLDDVYGVQFDMACEGVALSADEALGVAAYAVQWEAMAASCLRAAGGAVEPVEWSVRVKGRSRRPAPLWGAPGGLAARMERWLWRVRVDVCELAGGE
jgi:hypothetical protein